MTKILGIDTGTNSHGWAIVEKQADEYHLLDKGVDIFQEGVLKTEKTFHLPEPNRVLNVITGLCLYCFILRYFSSSRTIGFTAWQTAP